MALSGRQEEAAALVAVDSLTHEAIAQQCGVTRKTIYLWLRKPDFAKRVEKLRADYRESARRLGIALMERRVAELNDQYDRLKRVRDARAVAYGDEPLGGGTGLVVRQVKLVKLYDAGSVDEELEGQPHGGALKRRRQRADVMESLKQSVEVVEWPIDTGLLREMREHLKHVAIELGQWGGDEPSVDVGPGKVTITSIKYVEPAPANGS